MHSPVCVVAKCCADNAPLIWSCCTSGCTASHPLSLSWYCSANDHNMVILSSLTSRPYVLAPLRHHVCTSAKCLPQFDCLRHSLYIHCGSFPEFVESARLSPACSRVLSTITRVNSYILPFPSRHWRFLEPALVNFALTHPMNLPCAIRLYVAVFLFPYYMYTT